MKTLAFIAAVTALTSMSALAQAEAPAEAADKPAASPLTGNVALVSEYRYRGIAQTNGRPALQGGFDYAHPSGLYIGTWGSNVSWIGDNPAGIAKPYQSAGSRASASLEWDVYGGYKGNVGSVGYDVGVLQYLYPGSFSANLVNPNTTEVYVAGTYADVTAKYSYAVSNLFGFYDSRGSGYLDVTGTFALPGDYAMTLHAGHQSVVSSAAAGRSSSDDSFTDWKIGVTREMGGLVWGLAYIGTNAKSAFYTNPYNRDLGKATALLSVSKTF